MFLFDLLNKIIITKSNKIKQIKNSQSKNILIICLLLINFFVFIYSFLFDSLNNKMLAKINSKNSQIK